MSPAVAAGGVSSQTCKRNALKRAEQWMTKGGIIREDSDDELGEEDLPWEWIYDTESDNNEETGKGVQASGETPKSSRRRSSRQSQRKIIGARTGPFECRIGETVLLKSPEPGKDWAGIITDFLEEEDDEGDEPIKSANIMWFASPDEFISTRNKRRADALPNEQYLTTDFNVNPLNSINGKAQVMSKDAFFARYPNGAAPKSKAELAEYNKCIVCRRGVSQLQGRYTEEFVWEDVYQQDQIHELVDLIKDGLKAAKKRKQADADVSAYFMVFGVLHD
jgi:origin recognition complex subunit 1